MQRRSKLRFLSAFAVVAMAISIAPAVHAEDQVEEVDGPVPAAVLESFKNCPILPVDVPGFFCLKVRAYDGDLKLGSKTAHVSEPIEIDVAVGLNGLEPVIFTAEPEPGAEPDPITGLLAPILDRLGSCTAGVPISGGILGLPQLDPIINADPLGTLCLSATPQVGTPAVEDAFAFLNYLAGADDPITLGIPLSIKLNNLLLGEQCQIATPDAPITINLTNGTTTPPEGVEPMTGTTADANITTYMDPGLGDVLHARVTGSRFVDNAFAVPGATRCDILMGDLLGQPTGLFDPIVNSQAGLPSPAGNNFAAFSLDTEFLPYHAVHTKELSASPASLAFGSVAVGESSAGQTATVSNVGNADAKVVASIQANQASSYRIDGPCNGQVLAPGESCDLTIRFTPNGSGAKNGNLEVRGSGNLSPLGAPPKLVALTGTGTGTAPFTGTTLNFGNGYLGQTPTTQSMTFTNTTGSTITPGPSVIFSTVVARLTSWSIVSDGCNGTAVAPGGTCSIDVSFKPDSTGLKSVTLESRGANGVFLGSGAVNGTGALALSGPIVAFGSVPVGSQVGPNAVAFNNVSPNPVQVPEAGVILTGTASRFSSWEINNDGCASQTVPAGGSCVVQVTFKPDSTSFKNVILQILQDTLVIGSVNITGSGT